MREYQDIEHSILVDMLSEETARLTHLLSEQRFDQEYYNCKRMINDLTEEIASRSRGPKRYPDSSYNRE